MKEHNLDTVFKDKLKERKIEVSPSAWERLEHSLNESKPKRRKKIFTKVISIAASIALLFSVFIFQESNISNEEILEEKVVESNTVTIENTEKKHTENKKEISEKIVENENIIASKQVKSIQHTKNRREIVKNREKEINTFEEIDKSVVVKVDELIKEEDLNYSKTLNKKSRIQIHSEDLLYAVTHSPEEVQEYYAKNKVNRDDIIKVIELELQRSDLKINPEIILAEVEKSLDDEEFKGNFMQKIKIKITDIAIAFTERNK